jgi:hypothetical protein
MGGSRGQRASISFACGIRAASQLKDASGGGVQPLKRCDMRNEYSPGLLSKEPSSSTGISYR